MELTRKTPEEISDLARGIVTNRIYAAWEDEAVEYSFGMFMTLAMGSAQEQKQDTAWMNDIGLIYEDVAKANERGINGYPSFFSAKFLHRDDRIPLQRECIRMLVALGDLDADDLAKFDANVESFRAQQAEEKKEEEETT